MSDSWVVHALADLSKQRGDFGVRRPAFTGGRPFPRQRIQRESQERFIPQIRDNPRGRHGRFSSTACQRGSKAKAALSKHRNEFQPTPWLTLKNLAQTLY